MSLLPRSPELTPDAGPRVVGVDSDDADVLMAALSSETARCILSELHDEPAPPAEIAGRVDTTLQNAQYHLERLAEAGAIEVVGTAYSEKGREMDVYAPADQPLVIFAGREDSASGLRAALSRLLGGFAALALGAVAIQEVFGRRSVAEFLPLGGPGGMGGDDAGDPAPGGDGGDGAGVDAGTETATSTATPEPTPGADGVTADTTRDVTETATPGATPTPTGGANGAAGGGGTSTATPHATGTPTPTEATDAAAATPTPTPQVTETAANATATASDAVRLTAEAGGLPPGLLFFLGGALVLTVGVAVTVGRR